MRSGPDAPNRFVVQKAPPQTRCLVMFRTPPLVTPMTLPDGGDPIQEQQRAAQLRELTDKAVLLVGWERVWNDDTTRFLHSYDASLERGHPDLVVAPRDTEELAALIAAAYRCG